MALGRMLVVCLELSFTALMKSREPKDVAEARQMSTTGTKADSVRVVTSLFIIEEKSCHSCGFSLFGRVVGCAAWSGFRLQGWETDIKGISPPFIRRECYDSLDSCWVCTLLYFSNG